MSGSVTIDLNSVGDIVNNGLSIGANVTGGVAQQANLMGTTIGLIVVIGLLVTAILLILGIPQHIVGWAKNFGH